MPRSRGSKNRGFFYRSGRGWYATSGKRMVALLDEHGKHLKDKDTPDRELREAYARFLLSPKTSAVVDTADPTPSEVTVLDVCTAYLEHVRVNNADSTFTLWADTLFDWCVGLPPRYRNTMSIAAFRDADIAERKAAKDAVNDRIHKGYAKLAVSALRPIDLDQWLNAHPNWKSSRRTRLKAVICAMNYAVEKGLIPANPIKGFKMPKIGSRVTYITPEQEDALLTHAKPDFAMALRICIRTGMRFGSEFARVTKHHIHDRGDRMEIHFQAHETKARKRRTIFVTDPEIIKIIRDQCSRWDTGGIFRHRHWPWSREALSKCFRRVKKRAEETGVVFDPDCCMYSCRHTYAKRILQGYWSGMPTNIETLAKLMGNSPQVCRDHYLQWSELDHEHVWSAA